MREKFCRYNPIITTLAGTSWIFIMFVLHLLLYDRSPWLFWMVLSVSVFAISFKLGLLLKKLYMAAMKDALTGLYNRHYFYKRLDYEMEKVRRNKTYLSFIIIDVDDFKVINDTFGHMEGDKALMILSKVFKSQTGKIGTVCRWGGEEFALILPGMDSEGSYMFAERIRKTVEKLNFSYKITVCIGVSTINHVIDKNKFIAAADDALYKAKKNKNSVISTVA